MAEARLSAPARVGRHRHVALRISQIRGRPDRRSHTGQFWRCLEGASRKRASGWEIQRGCEYFDAIARFRQRSAATLTGLIVLALVAMPDALLDVQLERLDNFARRFERGHPAESRGSRTLVRTSVRREAEIEARARKMDVVVNRARGRSEWTSFLWR